VIAGVPDDSTRFSLMTGIRHLLQVVSPWAHGITLPFLMRIELVNSRQQGCRFASY
jgi:hypothetical protein